MWERYSSLITLLLDTTHALAHIDTNNLYITFRAYQVFGVVAGELVFLLILISSSPSLLWIFILFVLFNFSLFIFISFFYFTLDLYFCFVGT